MTLDEIAIKHGTDKCSKGHGYTLFYEPYFEPLRNQEINLLEIGVHYGRSIRTWAEYFPKGIIYGVDIKPGCKKLERESRVYISIGSQADKKFLTDSFKDVKFDIIIDDGSHHDDHMLISYEALWSYLKSKGLYIIEDLCVTFRNDRKAQDTQGMKSYLCAKAEQMMRYNFCEIERMDFTRSICIVTKR